MRVDWDKVFATTDLEDALEEIDNFTRKSFNEYCEVAPVNSAYREYKYWVLRAEALKGAHRSKLNKYLDLVYYPNYDYKDPRNRKSKPIPNLNIQIYWHGVLIGNYDEISNSISFDHKIEGWLLSKAEIGLILDNIPACNPEIDYGSYYAHPETRPFN